jgi:uncharacterized protein (TIGR03067 family)
VRSAAEAYSMKHSSRNLREASIVRGPATLLFILLAATSAMTAEKKPLSKELQGEWVAVDVEFNGSRPPKEILDKLDKYLVTIKDDKIPIPPLGFAEDRFFIPEGGALEVRCQQDPSTNPKEIDLIFMNGDTEIRMLGIYSIEAKQLKICWQHNGKARPKEFKTAKEPSQMLLVLDRKR